MNGERILIVDDDAMSVKLIRALLTGEGHMVHPKISQSSTGSKARDMLLAWKLWARSG
jgi:CheY-like chemotaxis protein